jgi:hypothetical protein
MSRVKPLPVPRADSPAPFTKPDVAALQAVYRGEGTPDQQQRAMDWIIKEAGQVGKQSYRAGDSHATAFSEGRRFVATQIVSLLDLPLSKVKDDEATK